MKFIVRRIVRINLLLIAVNGLIFNDWKIFFPVYVYMNQWDEEQRHVL